MQNTPTKVSLARKIEKNQRELGITKVSSMEELANVLSINDKKQKREQITFWYLLKVHYVTVKNHANRKPTMDKEDYMAKLQQSLAQQCIELNNAGFGALIAAPDVVYSQVISVLKREVIDVWYANSNDKRTVKGDPKGKERIEKIETAYWDIVKNDRKNILGNFGTGRFIYNEDGECSAYFISSDKSELMGVSLAKSRQARYENNNPEVKKVLLGGSVSTTSLTDVKNSLTKLAQTTKNKEYFTAVAQFLNTVI